MESEEIRGRHKIQKSDMKSKEAPRIREKSTIFFATFYETFRNIVRRDSYNQFSTRFKSQPMIPKPTDAELEILLVLWKSGTATVREVNDALKKHTGDDTIGYTTTLKIMQIMADKGLLRRDESQRSHVYSAAVREDDVQSAFVNKLLTSVFRGSAMNLVMQALGTSKPSSAELKQIRALLDEEIKNNQE